METFADGAEVSRALEKFKHRAVTITGRSRAVSMDRRLGELRRYVRGGMGIFGVASQVKLFVRLDGCIRYSVLLLETAEASEDASPSSDLIGRPTSSSNSPCPQPARSLVSVQHHRPRSWPDQRMARRANGFEFNESVGRACAPSLCRRMRTRTYGGVGRRPGRDVLTRFTRFTRWSIQR